MVAILIFELLNSISDKKVIRIGGGISCV